MRSRSYKRIEFTANGTQVTEAPEGTRLAVYARKVSGTGSVTVAVNGAFVALPGSNDLVQLAAATSAPTTTGEIVEESSNLFPYLAVTASVTGAATVHVYVAGF